jgi:hypothetical protein
MVYPGGVSVKGANIERLETIRNTFKNSWKTWL